MKILIEVIFDINVLKYIKDDGIYFKFWEIKI